jgi:hypothetical protein
VGARGRTRKFFRELVEDLLGFAGHQFRLDVPDDSGKSMRWHLEQREFNSGKRPKGLDGPPLPDEIAYLWAWFCEMHAGRSRNALGPSPATHLDLLAWRQNLDIEVKPAEVRALILLGQRWMEAMSGGGEKASAPASDEPEKPPAKGKPARAPRGRERGR